ncbi:flavin reductase family protein [Rhodoblastus acidophilus]|uniref:Flavin reductase family protein n=1 Tax=Candidatus Rhodoblastus alkanivorans TaxID=2954117 RepID=A0ABS9Z683_9HYPH|nr:flavin reductase family protein [Candidatus Rhodoblastus alkanivorans]MCI4680093.1 flavin reductase family protein [Candidatus Rhodoblastus alkanivorans]MCI4682971.1 flavin reductase family protein [Candidatus Rhodoblastus alkanivorans]MDI4640281.1 flavin reductase family protein [Rhodoblastus acidophilus]
MFYETDRRDRALLPHDPFKAMVAPRPIGWISTRGLSGAVNLAPYSFFNAIGGAPPLIAFSSEGAKDSATFAEESGEFVWNLATFPLRDAMNATSASLPRGKSEFEHAGLASAPGVKVKAPRVAASPCSLECMVTEIVRLKDISGQPMGAILTIGQVVGVHLDEAFIRDGRFDLVAAQPILRCGYAADYATIGALFQMARPG